MPAARPVSAKNLIKTITDSEALAVFVPRIDPHTLKHLLEDVGIEDAGSLIAHVSQNQLAHLLDETIWTGAAPGDPDKLSVAELLRWLDLWNELGAGFTADKLYDLGDDFCALIFSRLLIISDSDLSPRVLDEHTQAIGPFLVRVRIDDEWDTVQSAISALWSDYPDFAEAVLSRLSFRHSTLKMFGEDDVARVLDADAGHAHEQGREESGHVTSIAAGSFLRQLAEADVDVLSAETRYDLQTQEYFRRRRQLRRHSEAQAQASAAALEDPDEPPVDPVDSAAAQATIDPADDKAELDNLSAALHDYERAQARPAALLTGPETAVVQDSDWIRVALGRLQTSSDLFDQRMDELTYLANLLMVGTEAGGERLESGAAANLVVSTCNLGACHERFLGSKAESLDAVDAVFAMLETEPGLIRLFRIGWHLLTRLPIDAAGRLVSLFQDEAVRARLGEKPWVLSEVDALLGNPDFEALVAARKFEDAQETLKILGIALEVEAVVVLCVLTDGVPRFARVLESAPGDGTPPDGAVMTYASRDVATMGDLLAVHRFLDGLEDQVRL